METLSNFSSIYCFIAFILGAVFMFIAVCVVAMGKVKETDVEKLLNSDKFSYAESEAVSNEKSDDFAEFRI